MARTFSFQVTVADTGGPPYGWDDAGPPPAEGAVDPDPAIMRIKVGAQEEDYRIFSIMVYATGIEMFTNEESGPFITPDGSEVTEIRLSHSGGVKTVTAAQWAGSAGVGYLYLWYPDLDQIWTAADIGLTYTVEFDTTADPVAPPGPTDTIVNTGPQKFGDGKSGRLLEEGPRTATTTAEVTGGSGAPGSGGTGAKGSKGEGGSVVVDVPDQAGVFDLTPFIEGYDFASGKWYTILEGANITAGNTRQRLRVSPAVDTVANQSANDLLPYMWRLRVVHGDATEVVYSASYHLF